MTLNGLSLGTQQLLNLIPLPLQLRDNGILTGTVLSATQLLQMHLIRAISNTQRADHRPQVRQRGILTHTRSAVGLHGAVDDGQRSLRDQHLSLGDFLEGGLGVALVDLDGGVEDNETRSVDFNARPRDPFEDHAVRGQTATKRLLAVVVDARDHPLDGLFGCANGAHRVVDASGAQTALDDFETAAFAQDHAGNGHAHVVKRDVAVAVGGVVVAVHGQHPLDLDTGGVGWHQDHGLLAVGVFVGWVRFAHDQVDRASWVSCARRPPFLYY